MRYQANWLSMPILGDSSHSLVKPARENRIKVKEKLSETGQPIMDINDLSPVLYFRRIAGLTQEQLAKRNGVSEEYIRRCEKGMIAPTELTFDDIGYHLHQLINTTARTDANRPSWTQAYNQWVVAITECAVEVRLAQFLPIESQHFLDIGPEWKAMYDSWVRVKRAAFRNERPQPIGHQTFKNGTELRYGVTKALGLKKSSRYALCEALALHPFVVSKFEKDHLKPLSSTEVEFSYRSALIEAGVL